MKQNAFVMPVISSEAPLLDGLAILTMASEIANQNVPEVPVVPRTQSPNTDRKALDRKVEVFNRQVKTSPVVVSSRIPVTRQGATKYYKRNMPNRVKRTGAASAILFATNTWQTQKPQNRPEVTWLDVMSARAKRHEILMARELVSTLQTRFEANASNLYALRTKKGAFVRPQIRKAAAQNHLNLKYA